MTQRFSSNPSHHIIILSRYPYLHIIYMNKNFKFDAPKFYRLALPPKYKETDHIDPYDDDDLWFTREHPHLNSL